MWILYPTTYASPSLVARSLVYPCLSAIAHFLQRKVAPLRCISGSRKVIEVARTAASRVGVCGAVQRKYDAKGGAQRRQALEQHVLRHMSVSASKLAPQVARPSVHQFLP